MRPPRKVLRKPINVAGFSLIEVLVSVVIVTMGLLGLAGMSIRSLAANDSSGYRATAALAALQVSDAMRGNRQLVIEDKFDAALGAASLTDPRAQSVISAWKGTLARLPLGDGSIAYSPATQTVLVTVQWDDRRGNQSSTETSTLQTYAYSFRP